MAEGNYDAYGTGSTRSQISGKSAGLKTVLLGQFADAFGSGGIDKVLASKCARHRCGGNARKLRKIVDCADLLGFQIAIFLPAVARAPGR